MSENAGIDMVKDGDLAVVGGEDGMGCKVGCRGEKLTTFLTGRSVEDGSVRERCDEKFLEQR
jgi:hypothetical protein